MTEDVDVSRRKAPWPFEYENPAKFSPFWFENVDTFKWKEVMVQNPNVGWYTCAIYLCLVFSLKVGCLNRLGIFWNRPIIKGCFIISVWNRCIWKVARPLKREGCASSGMLSCPSFPDLDLSELLKSWCIILFKRMVFIKPFVCGRYRLDQVL